MWSKKDLKKPEKKRCIFPPDLWGVTFKRQFLWWIIWPTQRTSKKSKIIFLNCLKLLHQIDQYSGKKKVVGKCTNSQCIFFYSLWPKRIYRNCLKLLHLINQCRGNKKSGNLQIQHEFRLTAFGANVVISSVESWRTSITKGNWRLTNPTVFFLVMTKPNTQYPLRFSFLKRENWKCSKENNLRYTHNLEAVFKPLSGMRYVGFIQGHSE